uniref:Uncharacterized protein n=1 Tax=Leersia perrieri TaxID=77586 RepID=A0A0D9UWF3_9ORYZ
MARGNKTGSHRNRRPHLQQLVLEASSRKTTKLVRMHHCVQNLLNQCGDKNQSSGKSCQLLSIPPSSFRFLNYFLFFACHDSLCSLLNQCWHVEGKTFPRHQIICG